MIFRIREQWMPSVLLACLLAGGSAAHSQTAPSAPPTADLSALAECKFADGKFVRIKYLSPAMHGRKIFGELVKYDAVWSPGSGSPPMYQSDALVEVDGNSVPGGVYSLLLLPSAGEWKLIVSKQIGEDGTAYDAKQDLVRTNLRKSAIPAAMEQFTISLEVNSANTCRLNFEWELLRLSVKVEETQ